MGFSVQQVLVDPNGAPRIPKATSGAATSDMEPPPLHMVTKFGHLREDQARLEKQLQKLQAQVTPPCCPTTRPRTHPRLSKAPSPGPLSSLPHSATAVLVPTERTQ